MPGNPEQVAIEQLVDRLIAMLQTVKTARTPHRRQLHERDAADLHRQIEDAVSALYGLTPADVDIARAVPVPT